MGERLACHLIAEDFTVFDLHGLDHEDVAENYSTALDSADSSS